MYWFFSLSPCIQWVFIQDLWWLTSFCRKKLPAMAAERIRTKKLLAEVTKDLTPEQINGKSVSVFKKNVKETFRWSHVKKKRSASLSSWMCTEYTGKQFFLFLKKDLQCCYKGPWNAYNLYNWVFFCKYTSILCYTSQSFGYKD